MTSQSMEESKNAENGAAPATEPAPLEDQGVVAFLDADPQFFLRHPDLTARLLLPHGPGGSISLVERQMAMLRSQLDTERRRLAQLLERAREYEALSGQLHVLVLQLISAPDLERIESILCGALCKEFETEAVTLKLFAVGADADGSDRLLSTFLDFVDREHALCGPLDTKRATALFGDEGGKIKSAALIPIRSEIRTGVLAIGSADPERFGPNMGTDHLDRLGEVVSRRLGVIGHGDG